MKYISFFFILCFSLPLFSQSKKVVKEQAKAYIAAAHYEDAINVLESNRQLSRKDEEGRFLMAVCHYQLNDLTASKQLIEILIETEKSPYPECWFYLGKIYHAQEQFTLAIEYYKTYLRLLKPNHPNRAMLIQEIRRCDNGLRLRFREAQTVVENMGQQVNTNGDEFGVVLSPNRSTQIYFSAIKQGNTGGARNGNTHPDETFGHHLSDMFSTRLSGGQWQSPQALHYLLNTPQHEQLIGFSNQGNVLLYYKGWIWGNGEIFADTFQQEAQRSLKTTPFIGPAKGNAGEQNLFLYNDTLLIFASRRAGGYGGLDLYKSSFKNNTWSAPQNMGPTINSIFDETTPFLSRDGSTLYFSTNDSQKSVGGLDVVRSVYIKEARRWSTPENLGFPVNSPADDAHFILANDGFTAFLSSARKDGYGQRDLYIAYFTKYRKEMEIPETISFSLPNSTPVTTRPTAQSVRINTTVQPPWPGSSTPIKINHPPPPIINPIKKTWSSTASNLTDLEAQSWIQEVITAAREYPEDHLILTCYLVDQEGKEKSETLFRGIYILQGLSKVLTQNGVAESRVFLRSLMSLNDQNQLSINIAPQQKNVNHTFPVIGLNQAPTEHPSSVNQALIYKVQVISVERSYSNEQLSQQEFLMLENAAALPYLRYTVGASSTYQEADRLRRHLGSIGYNGAYVIPYLYGERIDKVHARQFVEQFPDLLQYLDR